MPSSRRGRPPNSTQPQRDLALIVRQAAAHLFAERGFAATHMTDIARASGVTPGALYHHYPSKEALLIQVIEEVLGQEGRALELALATEAAPPEQHAAAALLRLLEHELHTTEKHAVLRGTLAHLSAEQQGHVAEFFTVRLLQPIERVLRQGIESGEFRIHDVQLSAWTFMGILENLSEIPPGLIAELPRATLDLFLRGVRAEE